MTVNAEYCELMNILSTKEIRTVYQPIFSLVDGEAIGYEALSRGLAGSMLESPVNLFQAATKYNKVWELELLCRIKALERSSDIIKDKTLFLNVDPNIIKDDKFIKGFTKDFLSQYKMNPQNIIFEITEKTAIADYKSFREVIDHYMKQGYKIAIDDMGSGYSGLRTVAETCPQFIKIDMELVRNIDRDFYKQAMIKTFHHFAWMTNMKIIAEGIETEEELSTLIDLGIYYGQGYFLQRPSEGFLSISPKALEVIRTKGEQRKKLTFRMPATIAISEITRQEPTISPETLGKEVDNIFRSNPMIQGLVVAENKKTVGLVMRTNFYAKFAGQYGVVIFMGRPIKLIMDPQPFIVDCTCPLETVSRMSISRHNEQIYDYIIVTKNDEYLGIVTIRDLLERTMQLELNRAKHLNPLTGLPGNLLIEEALSNLLQQSDQFAMIYIDIDNFKPYNDVYGFENGDNVISLTANLLARSVQVVPGSFLGHIGGDDFVIVTASERVRTLCEGIISDFDRMKLSFYTESDQQRGYIMANNRHGKEERYPLLTISLAVVINQKERFSNVHAISERAALVKKQCKAQEGSCYLVG